MPAEGIWRGKKIGVIYGGESSEREVSLETGIGIHAALLRLGYDAILIDQGPDIGKRLSESGVQVVFNALHGKWGEDGCVQGLLEVMHIPYTGSKVFSSALAMNKHFSKIIFRNAGLPVGDYILLNTRQMAYFDPAHMGFGFPVVVKPNTEGSSVGVSIVKNADELNAALKTAADWDGDILIERFIKGREIQITVLNDKALGAIEVVPAEEFYNYAAKYTLNTTKYLYPAPLDEKDYAYCMEVGLAAHRALGCEGVTRTDLILAEGRAYVLEVNTLPGMTSHSLVPKTAAGIGIGFDELVERILDTASLGIAVRERS